jgi:hypothetical protein
MRTFHIYSLLSAKHVIDLQVLPFTNCEFCENWFSEGCTLFKDVNGIVLVAVFLAQFGQNTIKNVHKTVFSNCEFCANPYNANHSLFRSMN